MSQEAAIVGMAGLFPRAPDLASFWENILNKVDAISDPPSDWGGDLVTEIGSVAEDRIYTSRGGYLGDLASFNPLDFGVMPRAVDGAEPEHFLALRVAYEALADAGLSERDFNRERTAVILGRGTYVNRAGTTVFQHAIASEQLIHVLRKLRPEYAEAELQEIKRELKQQLPPFNAETAPGLVPSVMCGRIANRLDLMGPAYAVDAACASSLVALEIGMEKLASHTADMVLVGGVQVSTSFPITLIFCVLGALSRRGEIRPFQSSADGTLLGEGVGMLVLKRRDDAQKDGDRIYAVVKGVGTASDGRGLGVLAPRVEGEELALRRAYAAANISPTTVGLMEAHGTATPVGDAAELEALNRVFGHNGSTRRRCALGSVKSMIGHTIPAAGAAGLIKAALSLSHKVLPPSIHVDEPSPLVQESHFYLIDEPRPWISGSLTPRRAGVSAFGFGGINAHVVLEEHR